jgi:hypothetical protein
MEQGTRRGKVRWGSAARVSALSTVAAVVGAALLAACSALGLGPASGRIRIGTAPAASGAVASAPVPAGPVVSAWIASQRAFENAARTADSSAPELAATTVAPLLAWSESLLMLFRVAKEVAVGPVDLGDPQVINQGPVLATVRACVHDSEVVVSSATGRSVAGVLGQVDYELFTSTMERTASGWKLASQTVGVDQCSAS